MMTKATADTVLAYSVLGVSEPSTGFLIIIGVVSLVLCPVFLRMKLG